MKKLVFVCTGNICRSPMAEYLMRHHLRGDTRWQVSSAGLFAALNLPASPPAVEVVRELGVDLTPHRSKLLTKDMVDEAAWVVVMTQGHALEASLRHSAAMKKVRLLTSFADKKTAQACDISDPIGCSVGVYRTIRDEINTALLDLILFLKKGQK